MDTCSKDVGEPQFGQNLCPGCSWTPQCRQGSVAKRLHPRYCCKPCVITSIYEYCSGTFPPDGFRPFDARRPRGILATEPQCRQVIDICALPPRRILNLLVFPGMMGLLHLLQYNRLNRVGLRILYLSHSRRALRRCLSARVTSFGAISRAAQMRAFTLLAATRFLTLELPCIGGLPVLT